MRISFCFPSHLKIDVFLNSEEVLKFNIFTIDGKKVNQGQTEGKRIETSNLLPGMYFLSLQASNAQTEQHRRILVSRTLLTM